MAAPCMPRSARMPIEKIRIPISASISITPAWFLCARMAISSVAEPGIGVVSHSRVAHAYLPGARDVDLQAAHRARRLAQAAVVIRDRDLRDRAGTARTAQAVENHRAGGCARAVRGGDHRVRRAFGAAALLDGERRGGFRGRYIALAGGIVEGGDPAGAGVRLHPRPGERGGAPR